MILILAGRDLEVAAILGQLDAVRKRPAVNSVLVRGPGGIGKSRLMETIALTAEEAGSITIIGRAESFDRGIPLGVIQDAISGIDPTPLEPAARLVLEQLRRALEARPWFESSNQVSPRQLDLVVGLMAELLSMLSAAHPTVVVLDDLHLADAESINLYGLLARQLVGTPVLFVLAARPGYASLRDLEAFAERLAAVNRALVIDLSPLSPDAVAELVAAVLNHPPAPDLSKLILDQSAGNPFFARELTLQLVAEQKVLVRNGRSQLDDSRFPYVPAAPRSLTGRFFEADSDEASAAGAMSIFGRFSVSQLPLIADLAGLEISRLAWCCDRLVANQLLTRSPRGFEFAHPLLKSSLYRELGATERRHMHAAVAARLSQLQAEGLDVDPFEWATHVAASAPMGDSSATAVLLTAARLAMQNAPLVAAQWFESALKIINPTDPGRPDVHSEHVFAYLIGAQSGHAVRVGLSALQEISSTGRRSGLVFATVNALFAYGQLLEAVALIDEHGAGGPDDPVFLAFKVSLLLQLGRIAESLDLYSRAKGLLDQGFADPLQLITTCVQLYCFAQAVGNHTDCANLQLRIRQAIPGCSPSVQAEFHHFLALIPGLQSGALTIAETDLRAAKQLRGGVTSVSAGGNAESASLMIDWLRGNWQHGLVSIDDAIELLEFNGNNMIVSSLRGCTAIILTDQGKYQRAQQVLEKVDFGPTAARPLITVARARISAHLGAPTEAIAILEQFCKHWEALGLVSFYSLAAEEWATLELNRGNTRAAIDIARRTEAVTKDAQWPLLDVFARRLTAVATGDVDAGREALALARRENMPIEAAKCLLLLNDSGAADPEELILAYETFAMVEAAPWLRRTNQALRRIGRAAPRRQIRPDLTSTELSMIALVVQGQTNRQIASQLRYSVKTVELYLSRLYAKTGCQSRVELARAALQGQLGIPHAYRSGSEQIGMDDARWA